MKMESRTVAQEGHSNIEQHVSFEVDALFVRKIFSRTAAQKVHPLTNSRCNPCLYVCQILTFCKQVRDFKPHLHTCGEFLCHLELEYARILSHHHGIVSDSIACRIQHLSIPVHDLGAGPPETQNNVSDF